MGESFAFTPEVENDSAVQVERGTVFPAALCGRVDANFGQQVDHLIGLANSGQLEEITTVDRAGHSRPAYPGLLVYSWSQAARLLYGKGEPWHGALRKWCERLVEDVEQFDWPIGGLPAKRGAEVTGAAWCALALLSGSFLLGEKPWAERAEAFFSALGANQRSGGTFLRASASDNPETLWYNELVLLHAMSSYAAQANDALATAAVMQAADYHLNETQPDHASSQPWGLLAFVWRHETRPLADQLLHAARTHRPESADGIASMLLADCIYCLQKLTRGSGQ